MSTPSQATLDTYTPPESTGDPDTTTSDEPAQRPSWRDYGDADTGRTCQNCGSHVAPRFRRVFAREDSQPLACPRCSTTGELMCGAAADPEFEHRVDWSDDK